MIGRPLKHFGMAQGTDYVVIPGTPMVLHAPTRELVILRRPLITLGVVDEMDDVVDLSISHIPEQRGLRTAAKLLRQLIKQVGGGAAKPLYSLAVLARVRLEYWISFWRVDTSAKLRGSLPRALQRST
jgi:hypothetical protein